MILFLKSSTDDGDNKMPLHEKLMLIFKDWVKEAEGDEDRARAERELEKLRSAGSRD